jgi:hypothetical protein
MEREVRFIVGESKAAVEKSVKKENNGRRVQEGGKDASRTRQTERGREVPSAFIVV